MLRWQRKWFVFGFRIIKLLLNRSAYLHISPTQLLLHSFSALPQSTKSSCGLVLSDNGFKGRNRFALFCIIMFKEEYFRFASNQLISYTQCFWSTTTWDFNYFYQKGITPFSDTTHLIMRGRARATNFPLMNCSLETNLRHIVLSMHSYNH
jgi:hypothetical protein